MIVAASKKARLELEPEALYRHCSTQTFGFKTTTELSSLPSLTQTRATKALRSAMGIKHKGFNLYALGPVGSGKRSLVETELSEHVKHLPVPFDLCYVNNFREVKTPQALCLPAGEALKFKEIMEQLLDEVMSALPAAFESDDYQARRQALDNEFSAKPNEDFASLEKEAEAKSFKMLSTPVGIVFAPIVEGKVISPDAYSSLTKEKQETIQAELKGLQENLQKVLRQVSNYKRELEQQIRELNREITDYAVGHLIKDVRGSYQAVPVIVQFLDALELDIAEHTADIIKAYEAKAATPIAGINDNVPLLRRYKVNVLIDHSKTKHAPVVFEDNPSYENLVGRIEHIAQMGTLVTDFNLIRAGALHKANGGYLLLDARKVLQQAYAWEGLKRALKAESIRIESLGQVLSLVSTVSLEPEPVPLNVKVILLGDRLLYYLLCAYDPEFEELFKLSADFDDEIERTPESQQTYAQFLATLANQANLRPLDAQGVARAIEHSSRLAGDAQKLSAHVSDLADLLTEADFIAEQAGQALISADSIQAAISAQFERAGRLRERILESTLRGTRLIATEGQAIGQINGLSVMQLGKHYFGQASRITARVRLGKGEVIDIEREVEMGGPIHSKGVMILSSYLGAHYADKQPLSLKANLVFEQSYAGVEGDSASCAELCALVSAIAQVPLKQSLAITGSINQYGQVQAIGGVNEKIEGFFDLCKARALSGDQGVIIPVANVQHLMLRQDVVTAVKENRFHIYAVSTINEALELFTDLPMGKADAQGNYPTGSFNALLSKQLAEFSKIQLELSKQAHNESS